MEVLVNVEPLLSLMPLLPFLGFLLIGLGGRRIPAGLAGPLACVAPALALAIALPGFLQVSQEGAAALHSSAGDWMRVGDTAIGLDFTLDRLSAVLCLVVTGVGTLIHVYSIGYMREDPGRSRFFAYLNLFLSAMLVLALADNLVLLFLGWEGVGLCSYLLIGFWFDDEANASAGRKAFVVNRIGDFGFLLGIFLAFDAFGSFRLGDLIVPEKLAQLSPGVLTAIALLFFVGATGKSAQVPLYVWLPDAMAGPTPVSALIHAATMVTSGVYLVARLEPLYRAAPGALEAVAAVGGLTAFLAAFIALSQVDIKRVLAYSTVSQLGYMFLAAGLGAGGVAVFHLMTHAFFKALLFLGAGAVIHSLHLEQDLRRMGGLRRVLPRTFVVFLAGGLAISGFPFFSGFFSKDAILYEVTERASSGGAGWTVLWALAAVTAAMTSFYTFRLIFLAFFGEERWRKSVPGEHPPSGVHESPPSMMVPLYLLALLSIFGGWIDVPGFLGEHAPHNEEPHNVETGRLVFALSGGAFAAGLLGACVLYLWAPGARERLLRMGPFPVLLRLSAGKLFVDELYGYLVVKPFRALSFGLFYLLDRLVIDTLLVEGTADLARGFGGLFRRIQSGRVTAYAAWFMAGAVALLAAMAFAGGK